MKNIKEILNDMNINFKVIAHPPVYTCKETKNYEKDIRGIKAKNLFLKSKDSYYLIIIPSEERLNIKEIETLVNKKLSFSDEIDLKNILNLSRGSVSPFGLIYDKDKKTTLIISRKLMDSEYLSFHPNINTETLELNKKDFLMFLDNLKINLLIY